MSNNYYGSTNTATAVKFDDVPPYVFTPLSAQLPSPEPTQDSSEFKSALMDSARRDDRVVLAVTCLQRAKEYMAKNDPMQASEKLYKATEEAIKFLAEHHGLSEIDTAEKRGRWSTGLLGTSSKKLTEQLAKKEIDEAWTKAFDVHVLGFHKNQYRVAEVAFAVPYIENLITYVEEVYDAR